MFSEDKTHKPVSARRKAIFWAVGIAVGIAVIVMAALRIALKPSNIQKLISKFAPEYIDADVVMGNIEVSLLKHFPHLYVSIEDFALTYPHERYARFDNVGARGFLRKFGRGEEKDTLAAFQSLNVTASYMDFVRGLWHVNRMELVKPRIFASMYNDSTANWNILKTASSDEPGDTTSSPLPKFEVNKLVLNENPLVVFTDVKDTVFALLAFRGMDFNGRLTNVAADKIKLNLSLDSLIVAGRLPADTLALGINSLGIRQDKESFHISSDGHIGLALSSYGRLGLPVGIDVDIAFPEKNFDRISVSGLEASLAMIDMKADGDFILAQDSTYIKAEVSVPEVDINKMVEMLGKEAYPELQGFKTNARLSLTALADGWYNAVRGTLPELVAEIALPSSSISYPAFGSVGDLSASINAETDENGNPTVTIDDLTLNYAGAKVDLLGEVKDMMGGDPYLSLLGTASLSLDSLNRLLPEELGYQMTGDVNARLDGDFRLSQLTAEKYSRAMLDAEVYTDHVEVLNPKDTLYAYLGKTSLALGMAGDDAAFGKGTLALLGNLDSLYATMGESVWLNATDVDLTVQTSMNTRSEEFGSEDNPYLGVLRARQIRMNGMDSLLVGVHNTKNTFRFSTRKLGNDMKSPILSFSSENGGLFMRSGVNRVGVLDAAFSASAVKRSTVDRAARRNRILDSLEKVYPGVPRDSLFLRARKAMEGRQMPDYLQERDFWKNDLNLDFGENVRKYLREWTISGKMDVDSGIVITPYFPLRNRFGNVAGTFNNDEIMLDNFTFEPGTSDLSATGRIYGIRRALTGRAPLYVDVKLTSKRLNANELLAAYSKGSQFMADDEDSLLNASMSDDEYMDELAADSLTKADVDQYAMIVVPANVVAKMTLEGNQVDYSDLHVSWISADIGMKERVLQITNAVATTNMGDLYCEGFYSTRSKQDIKAGFDVNLVDITADKVIGLMPAIDTIMPMLKAFRGNLDLEMAATTYIDTNMNVITPSLNGMVRMSGRDMSIDESGAFKKIAKLLMFKNKKVGKIKDMSVEGLISDDRFEIFPFILGVDRYQLAMSGLQNFDQSFNYHVSVLKSPLPFRFGINLYGNFDDWKYKIGKAKYKNAKVPVFTAQIDTMQLNLISSIHNIFTKGVDVAVRSNEQGDSLLNARKAAIGYEGAEGIDSLSVGEKFALDSLRYSYDHPLDSSVNARIDNLIESEMVVTDEPEVEEYLDKQSRPMARRAAREARKAKREARKEAKKADNMEAF